jgi:hypothetical protein
MRVENNSRKTIFYDARTGMSHSDWRLLIDGAKVRNASLENHIINCSHFAPHPNVYLPVVESIYQIPPKTTWLFSKGSQPPTSTFEDNNFLGGNVTTKDFVEVIEAYIRRLGIDTLAVELSGGLDTSLIIALLEQAGMNPALIGLESERYEFRAERAIQHKFLNSANQGALLNYETALPFARLQETPAHALPNKTSLFYYGHKVIAQQAQKFGVRTVLNGIGIEPFLVEPITSASNSYLARLGMEDAWPNEYIFSEYQCTYVNVAQLRLIHNLLCNLRRGQPLDVQKLWARKYFSKILPRELSEYSYKAAFDGIFQAGINSEMSAIREILKVAYEFTKNSNLEPSGIVKKLQVASDLNHAENLEIMGKLSFANWVNSLVAKGLIT